MEKKWGGRIEQGGLENYSELRELQAAQQGVSAQGVPLEESYLNENGQASLLPQCPITGQGLLGKHGLNLNMIAS